MLSILQNNATIRIRLNTAVGKAANRCVYKSTCQLNGAFQLTDVLSKQITLSGNFTRHTMQGFIQWVSSRPTWHENLWFWSQVKQSTALLSTTTELATMKIKCTKTQKQLKKFNININKNSPVKTAKTYEKPKPIVNYSYVRTYHCGTQHGTNHSDNLHSYPYLITT